jgi:hypothetical protein
MPLDWKILEAHISELEALEDDMLRMARAGLSQAREAVIQLHRNLMEKRKRLRELKP